MAPLLPVRRVRAFGGPPGPLPGGPREWLEAHKRKQLLKERKRAAAKARIKKRVLKSITKLKDDASALQSDLATLAREQAEMDKIRAEEKAQYEVDGKEMKMIFAGKLRAVAKHWRGCKVVLKQQFDQFEEKGHEKCCGPQ